MKGTIIVSNKKIINKIYLIRGKKVMVDRDLAEMYKVEAKRLKEAVRRNIKRFPNDFMFQMTIQELDNWRTQFASSKEDKIGLRYAPFCFTEQGVAMLSSVLKSDTAINVNIKIIRIFTQMRELLINNKDIILKLDLLEKKIKRQDKDLVKHETEIQRIFRALKQLIDPPQTPRRKIGYRRSNEN